METESCLPPEMVFRVGVVDFALETCDIRLLVMTHSRWFPSGRRRLCS